MYKTCKKRLLVPTALVRSVEVTQGIPILLHPPGVHFRGRGLSKTEKCCTETKPSVTSHDRNIGARSPSMFFHFPS